MIKTLNSFRKSGDIVFYSDQQAPSKQGERLANYILAHIRNSNTIISDMTINLSHCPSEVFISSFINSMLDHLYSVFPEYINDLKNATWIVNWEFQKTNLDRWLFEYNQKVEV